MRAVVLDAFGAGLRLADDHPDPGGPGEVIDVTACGVCHSDLHVVDGEIPSPLPLVLGHEVTGVHPRLGPVMVYAPWGCRSCELCAEGVEDDLPRPPGRRAFFSDGGYAGQDCGCRRSSTWRRSGRHRPGGQRSAGLRRPHRLPGRQSGPRRAAATGPAPSGAGNRGGRARPVRHPLPAAAQRRRGRRAWTSRRPSRPPPWSGVPTLPTAPATSCPPSISSSTSSAARPPWPPPRARSPGAAW